MNILFISDIHANFEALQTLEPYIKSCDLTICLGDIVGYNCRINEVIDFLRGNKVLCIQGNHDRYLIEGVESQTKFLNEAVLFGISIAKQTITTENLQWINNLPLYLKIEMFEKSILCCHGSPWDYTNEYVYVNSKLFDKIFELQYDYVALGHTHRQYEIKRNNAIIFNPGSVGQARDFEGKACAKILEVNTGEITNIIMPYNFMLELNYCMSIGANDWIYKHFRTIIE